MKIRGMLYFFAKMLGDVNAVSKGRVGRRVLRRVGGRYTGKAMGKAFR